eukprot:3765552-Pyramimonas_sp.AAC.1
MEAARKTEESNPVRCRVPLVSARANSSLWMDPTAPRNRLCSACQQRIAPAPKPPPASDAKLLGTAQST